MGTVFHAAEIVESHSAKYVFDAFYRAWRTRYSGAPLYAVVDEKEAVQSDKFMQYCADVGTTVMNKDVEAHWSFGSGERFHAALRDTWYRVVLDRGNLPIRARAMLQLCVFSLYSAPGSLGRASSLVVFGQIPRPLPSHLDDDTAWTFLPNHERLALQTVARESAEIAANELRLNEVRRRVMPTDTEVKEPGQLCYVYREHAGVKGKRPGFVGPFIVLWREGMTC